MAEIRPASGLRCRNQANSDGRCNDHPVGVFPVAPQPHVVLFRFHLNPARSAELEITGVLTQGVNWEARVKKHEEQARQLGQSTSVSGTQVFGDKMGLSVVSVHQCLDELALARGYKLEHISMFPQRNGKMNIVEIALSMNISEEVDPPPYALELLARLFASTWNYVHVWANPLNGNKEMVHVVTCLHRMVDEPNQYVLEFRDGLWGARTA